MKANGVIVGNAKLEGLTEDVNMSAFTHITLYIRYLLTYNVKAGNQYLTGLTLYFIAYVVFEIPCNIILKRTTPRIWLPTLTLIWGIVATLLGVVQNYPGYLVSRTGMSLLPSDGGPGGN